jgi:WD40 repeat protein/tetratricopeptide (TPR) repeat protein
MPAGGVDPAPRHRRKKTLALAVGFGLLAASSAAVAVIELAKRSTPPSPSTARAPLPERPPAWRFPVVSFARAFVAHMGAVESVVFAPNGTRLLTASADETAKVWDPRKPSPIHVLRGHSGAVIAARVAGDGSTTVTAGDRSLRVWSLLDGKPVRTIDADAEAIVSLAVSPSGRTLVGGDPEGVARVWDSGGALLATLPHGAGRVLSLAFSPDGSRLATAGDDATIKVWDVADWRLRQTLVGHSGAIHAVAVAPDGETLASGGDDGTVRLWQLERGTPLNTLSLHTDSVWSLAFSPDGRTLLSGGADAVVGVWSIPDGTLKQKVDSNAWARGTRAVAFAPDGASFATAHGDGEVAFWQVARSGAHLPLPSVQVSPSSPGTESSGDECVRAMDEVTRTEQAGKVADASPTQGQARGDWRNSVRAVDFCVRGWKLLGRKDEVGARQAAEAATRMAPAAPAAALLSARLDLQAGNLEEAEHTLRGALSRPLDRHAASSALATLADIYEGMGDVDADGEARRRAVEVQPEDAALLAAYAAFLTRRGDLDAALAAARQAAQAGVRPSALGSRVLATAYCRKGERLLWEQGEADAALRSFEEAAHADSRSACAAYGRGAYYEHAAALSPGGSKSAQSQAKSWYATAVGLDPSDALARRALARLSSLTESAPRD